MEPAKISFKAQQFMARERAILDATNALLYQKGYDLMSMDDVAAVVGIAKGSLYKHFASKEALAAAAMVRVLRSACDYVRELDPASPPESRLAAMLRWALTARINGQLPSLPSTQASLADSLMKDAAYVEAVTELNSVLLDLIEAAQASGALRRDLPSEVMLYALYARTCDPALDYIRGSGQWTDEEAVSFLLSICLQGIGGPTAPQP
jgi:AcrR family transcriptional regulator